MNVPVSSDCAVALFYVLYVLAAHLHLMVAQC
jgi:hypothetical protein